MEKKTLNVIVPVYNVDRYLEECMESLLAQTYSPLQIVLVNDCSTDNSETIVERYREKYPERIVVCKTDENMGIGGARNLGIKSTTSDYIGFVDADDFVHPRMFELLMEQAVTQDEDAAYCEFQKVGENDTLQIMLNSAMNGDFPKGIHHMLSDDESRFHIMGAHNFGSTWTGVYRRELIEEAELYFPEHLVYEDNFWVYALRLQMNTVGVINYPLYYYRQRSESVSQQKNAVHHYDRLEIERRLYDYVQRTGLLQKYAEFIEYIVIDVFTINTFSIVLSSFDNPDIDKLKMTKSFLKEKFPKWRKNRYYGENFSFRRKIRINLIMLLPVKVYKALFSRA